MARDLITEILRKRENIQRAGLNVTLSRIKKRFDLKSIEQAACFYIKKNNLEINVSSTIDDITRKVVQDNLATDNHRDLPNKPLKKHKNPKPSKSNDPLITDDVLTAAYNNAEIYPVVYMFENSVRKFVSMVMKKEHKDNWWAEKVAVSNPKIQASVAIRRLAEKDSPWHSGRAADSIFYTDINDLEKIINTYSKEFRKVLKSKFEHVIVWIDEIEKTRNILAHNNPIAKRDKDRLIVYAHDWSEFSKSINESI